MLAKRREVRRGNTFIERTPLLIPSFSSKGFPDAQKILETTSEVLDGVTLVSAYDIHYEHVKPPFAFASLVFLDSGGYEASKDTDLSELNEVEHDPRTWTADLHASVLDAWTSPVPTVAISYDHPRDRAPMAEQISRALAMAPNNSDFIREILVKPERATQTLLNMKTVLPFASQLARFDVVGVTEKEIGNSVLQRMENIARLRIALDRERLDIPIHVFGSLDTITTPLYFLAGADIFDGLTWLRFAYHQGYTMYKHNYGALKLGIKTKSHLIDGRCWFDNYRYLVDLQLEMRRFLNDYEFGQFQFHGNEFKHAYESVRETLGV
jgi:hypothetical protein